MADLNRLPLRRLASLELDQRSWPNKPLAPIFIEYAHNVTISDNKIDLPDQYAQPLPRVGVDVVNLKQDVTTSTP